MKNLTQDIKDKNWKPVYLLYGDENYLKSQYKKLLKEGIVGEDDMNYHYYEGKNIPIKQMIDLAETMPFFADYRLVLLENTGFFKSASEEMVNYLKDKPDSTIFVFVEAEVDKRNRLYKLVKETGYVCELNTPSAKDLSNWLLKRIAAANKQITRNTMELFINLVGEDMHMLANELEKVIAYDIENPVITEEAVQLICTKRIEVKIFDLFSAMSEGDVHKTFGLYYELVESKEPYMRILYMLGRQFAQLLAVKSLRKQGYSPKDVVAKLGLRSDWVVRQLEKQGSRYSTAQLKRAVEECIANEEAVKTGNLPEQEAVEMILVRYGKTK